jgi:hypothetical protein
LRIHSYLMKKSLLLCTHICIYIKGANKYMYIGADIKDLFLSFDEKPIASASLAQVHIAYSKDGLRKYAVKVQHEGDFFFMFIFSRLLCYVSFYQSYLLAVLISFSAYVVLAGP